MSEAAARVKINRLLEEAGWRFFDPKTESPPTFAWSRASPSRRRTWTAWVMTSRKPSKGFIDFLLLDDRGFPLIVLEAKSEEKKPLVGKEQARRYAREVRIAASSSSRMVTSTTTGILKARQPRPHHRVPDAGLRICTTGKFSPPNQQASNRRTSRRMITSSSPSGPNYANEAAWKNENEREEFKRSNKLPFLRPVSTASDPRAAKGGARGQQTASCSRWPRARARRSPPPPSSNCSCARETPAAFSFWWTGSNWKIRPTRLSGTCLSWTTEPTSTSSTATTGGAPR